MLDQENLWTAKFRHEDGSLTGATWWTLLKYMMGREQALVSVTLLCFAVSFLLHYFYLYHFWLIQRGLTTNEASKRSYLLKSLRKLI